MLTIKDSNINKGVKKRRLIHHQACQMDYGGRGTSKEMRVRGFDVGWVGVRGVQRRLEGGGVR